jgi:hypothetical protein
MLHAQARNAELDPGLVQVADHLQLLRRGHAAETFDLDRVDRIVHSLPCAAAAAAVHQSMPRWDRAPESTATAARPDAIGQRSRSRAFELQAEREAPVDRLEHRDGRRSDLRPDPVALQDDDLHPDAYSALTPASDELA